MVNGKVLQYWWCIWKSRDAAHLDVHPALPAHQTFWEARSLLISMITWQEYFKDNKVVLIIGDRVPSLHNPMYL